MTRHLKFRYISILIYIYILYTYIYTYILINIIGHTDAYIRKHKNSSEQ